MLADERFETLLDPWALGSIIVGKYGEVFMERDPQGRQYAEKRYIKVTGILETLNCLLNTLKKLLDSHHTSAASRT